MRFLTLLLFSVLLFTACQKPQTKQLTASPDAKIFALKGKIVSVDKAKQTAKINHQSIPNYMEAMTMDFPIHNPDILNTLTKDSEIKADLVVDKGEYWLENINVVVALNPDKPAPTPNEKFAYEGKEVPNFNLTNQDGKRIGINDYRGKALAVTFIYSRCPLPNYCILMSKNFSDLAIQMENKPELKDKIRLLSISFDPALDTPETLKKYGLGYMGKDAKYDFSAWQLATGSAKEIKDVADFFGLRYETDEKDKTQFNHSLITTVIAPDGKVKKVFSGNDWTTDELLNALNATIK
jgi:protein SCO1